MFGGTVSLQIIITQLVLFVLRYAGTTLTHEELSSQKLFAYISLASNYLIIFPLSLSESLTKFRYISIIALSAILYIAFILFMDQPKYYAHNYKPEIIVKANWDFFVFVQGFSICVFAYTCQNHILPIYGELDRLSTRRIYKVINRSVLIIGSLYLAVGLVGYFSTFDMTPRIVLERKSL